MWVTWRGHHFTEGFGSFCGIFVDLYECTGKKERNRDTWKWLGQASAHGSARFDRNAPGSHGRYKIRTQKEAEERPEGAACSDRRSLLEAVRISKEQTFGVCDIRQALRGLNGSCRVAQGAKRTLGEHRKGIQPQTIILLMISLRSEAAVRLFCSERLRGRGGLGKKMD